MAPPLKDGIWLTITPHKAVVETLSILGLTPNLHRHDDEKQDTIYLPNALSSWATGEISMWSAWEDSNLQPSDVNIADSVFKIVKKQQDP